jgi:hypothetical protein
MFDGESTLRQLLDDLAWIDKRESPGGAYGMLEARGAASPVGVRGVFMRMFGGAIRAHDDAVAFVYADLAHTQGYLRPERRLAAEEYSRLIRDARRWAADADRVTGDLIGEFGEPSLWTPRYNPRYPTSVAYVSRHALDPLVVFDFWQEPDQTIPADGARRWPEPVLRNVRWQQDRFEEGFTFTPIGLGLRARGTPAGQRRPLSPS